MPSPPHITALIVAAGKGERAGGALPKQFQPLGGKPMLAWSIEAFAAHPAIGALYVVIGAGQEEHVRGLKDIEIITGGATRADSVRNGLEAIAASGGTSKILIHDAARP
ncbi:MAG: 2-C-methyl-D-erythritol 4-phosphate cytidylyltransferase, partial [Alphaproteobacteria bacterium]|nr:2-C-methyl-D-erythritol 4-phosphate cytidylyltransferase [Alphaproteobacteria bacterium]